MEELKKLLGSIEITELSLASIAGSSLVIFELDLGNVRLEVGIRKLGLASLKGMEEIMVYEIVDGRDLEERQELEAPDLLSAIERQFALEHSGTVA